MKTFLIRLAAKNATRKPMRSLLTAGMVAVGTSMLVLSMSWIDGIFGQMLESIASSTGHVRVVDRDFAEREQLMPMHENLPDTDALIERIKTIEGVATAFPKIMTGVTVTVGEEIGDVFGMAVGAPAEYFTEYMDADADLTEGRWFDESKDEVVLGQTLVERSGATLGDEVVLLGMTQDGSMSPIKGTLVGIAKAGNPAVDMAAFASLEQMRWLTDIPDGALEVLVYGTRREEAVELAERLRLELGGDAYRQALAEREAMSLTERVAFLQQAQRNPNLVLAAGDYSVGAWRQRQPYAQMMPMIDAIQGILSFVFVLVVALGVWVTMMMSVLERTDEVGVMRAMGMTRLQSVLLFVGEAAVIAVLGGLIGISLGALPSWWLSVHGIELSEQITQNMGASVPISTHIYAALSGEIMLNAFVMGLLMAVFGSLLPAWRASTIQPVTAMRAGH